MTTIKFAKQFLKLHGQTSAELVAVKLLDTATISSNDFEELVEYDAKANDGSYYPLDRNKTYTQLIFIGNKNIPFTTLRNKNKYLDYMKSIGWVYDIEVENELPSDTFMQSMVDNYSDNDEHSDGSIEEAYKQAEKVPRMWLHDLMLNNQWRTR